MDRIRQAMGLTPRTGQAPTWHELLTEFMAATSQPITAEAVLAEIRRFDGTLWLTEDWTLPCSKSPERMLQFLAAQVTPWTR